ncbi:MAG: LysE family translocator [Rhodospirillaceae bacterium]|nr:LysE family translocator [Rhodospirillaceae bacterium]
MDWLLYGTFIAAAFALAITPGPDLIYVIARSLAQGQNAGLLATLGIAAAMVVHVTLITLGLSRLFLTLPWAYAGIKIAGALYLTYLAIQAFRSGHAHHLALAAARPWVILRQAALSCLLNPKLAVFFIAFLPQFTTPTAGPITPQLFILGATFAIIGLTVLATTALACGPIGRTLARHPTIQVWQSRLTGTLLAALAIRLAWPDAS